MSYNIVIMYIVALLASLAGVVMLAKLRSSRTSERGVYAYRMMGIMALSLGIVLAMSATAMWSWSMEG